MIFSWLRISDNVGLGRVSKRAGPSVVAAVTTAARIHTGFCFAWQRSAKAAVYFLYGRDEDQLLSTTRSFARGDTPFSGLLAVMPDDPPTQPR
jgi:hypothetical protein